MADRRRHDDAQADLGDAPRGGVKSVPGIERARNADDGHGVTGKDEAIGGPVPRVLRAKGAEPDPEGETAEEEDALLRAEGDEEERYGGADHRPDNAVEALRQDQPALLRLRDDENGEQGPIGLIEIEGEGDEQGDQPRSRRFGREDHPGAIFDCPLHGSRGGRAVVAPLGASPGAAERERAGAVRAFGPAAIDEFLGAGCSSRCRERRSLRRPTRPLVASASASASACTGPPGRRARDAAAPISGIRPVAAAVSSGQYFLVESKRLLCVLCGECLVIAQACYPGCVRPPHGRSGS